MRKTNLTGTPVYWFDDSADFARECDKLNRRECSEGWTGENWETAARRAAQGDLRHVPAAEALIEKVQTEIDVPKSEWVRARAGAFPVVPEALAGHPDSMRRRVQAASPASPLRVFVELTSSAGIAHEDLARRGVATLALSMALSSVRPVELYAVVGLGGGWGESGGVAVAVRIPAGPLDLATACNTLTSAGFARGLGYSFCNEHGSGGDWLFGIYPGDEGSRKRYVELLRAAVGAGPDDLIIPPTYLTDPAVKDPVGFVRRGIAEHTGTAEERAW